VGIKKGEDQQVTPYRLEDILVSRRQKLKGKTSGCRRYKEKEGFFKG
jgi:hypothetical protein